MFNLFFTTIFALAVLKTTPCMTSTLPRRDECRAKYDLSPVDVVLFISGAVAGAESLPERVPNIKCYAACVFEGSFLEDGVFQYESAIEEVHATVPDEAAKKCFVAILDLCRNSTDGESDPCEAAWRLKLCLDRAILLASDACL